jgi:predicted nucleic acid-binding protein
MMFSVVVLDTSPLGQATNPKETPENVACAQWVQSLLDDGVRVIVPEIADYEVRRELIRCNKTKGLERLERFVASRGEDYLPLTTAVMRQAAALWAQARQEGKQTAADAALDGDMILVAQAQSLNVPESEIIIATANVSDIIRFFPAAQWRDIPVIAIEPS